MRRQQYSGLPSWRLIAGTAGTALLASLALAFSAPAVMSIDGQRVVSDVAPVTAGGVAYVPLRMLGDASGALTTYEAATGALTIRRGAAVAHLRIGERRAQANGRAIQLAQAPFTVHGRVMLRGTDIATLLGSNVAYNARRGRIDVRTPGAVVAGVPDNAP